MTNNKVNHQYVKTVGISEDVVYIFIPDNDSGERTVTAGKVAHGGFEPYFNIVLAPRVLRMIANAMDLHAANSTPDGGPSAVFVHDETDGERD